jgi:hypothetical protein
MNQLIAMNMIEFLKTIYLGDRGCKSVLIDGWNEVLKIQATCISRVRGATWNYYADEDIPDGYLVFAGLQSVSFSPDGAIPNDVINDIKAECLSESERKFMVTLSIDAVDASGSRIEVTVRLIASEAFLEDPRNPSTRIAY